MKHDAELRFKIDGEVYTCEVKKHPWMAGTMVIDVLDPKGHFLGGLYRPTGDEDENLFHTAESNWDRAIMKVIAAKLPRQFVDGLLE